MKLISGLFLIMSTSILSCGWPENTHYTGNNNTEATIRQVPVDTVKIRQVKEEWNYTETMIPQVIKTGNTHPLELITYAQSLTGIPYKYGSIDPAQGFDCSGFITFVFNHFGIAVPRSSKDFNNVEPQTSLKDSKPGDLILFTGTDSTIREIGHMGIIASNNGSEIQFIHSTSGKAYGVTTSPLNKYYQGRYLKALRVFSENK